MSVAAQPAAQPALRLGARVLLLDPHDRVLLIHARDPDDPAHHWWELPGGGIGPDEPAPEAARRELAEHSGASAVPPRTGAVVPHRAQRAQRCLQARHHGLPVALEIAHGACRPQIEQVRISQGRHVPQSGPPAVRTLTLRLRPHWAHSSRLTGSLTRQLGQIGCPCSSRAAGSFTVPHRAHCRVLVLATQLRQHHSPSIRR